MSLMSRNNSFQSEAVPAPRKHLPASIKQLLSVMNAMSGRLVWLLLLLAHAPAFVALVSGEISDPIRLVGLLLSQIFFALKVADVRWLRLPTSIRGRVVVFICFALLHADVVRRTVDGNGWPEVEPVAWTLVLNWTLLLAAAGRAVRKLRYLRLTIQRRIQAALTVWHSLLLDAVYLLKRPLLLQHSLPHRAPPAPHPIQQW